MEQVIGYVLIASPFIGLFIFMWKESGLKVALSVVGLGSLILLIIGLGVVLVQGGLR